MAVTAYIGLPGSGKSYEVVRSVILPALAKGRRIVTNIYGIHDVLCRDFIINNPSDYKLDDGFGDIIHVTNEQVGLPRFFPDYDDSDKFCKKGDLILLDEVHRFFGIRLSKEQENFIAEHRHYADEISGQTCDLVIITQSFSTLPRFLRDRIDTTFKMTKLTHLGLRKRYRIDIYATGKLVKSNLVRTLQEKYNPKIFTLYDSNTVKGARETVADNRANMLRSKKFIAGAVLFPFILGFVVLRIIAFFNPSSSASVSENLSAPVAAAAAPAPESVAVAEERFSPPQESSDWCIAGTLFKDGRNFVVLTDVQHHLRFVPRKFFDGEGTQISGIFEGKKINSWSCPLSSVADKSQALPSLPLMGGSS